MKSLILRGLCILGVMSPALYGVDPEISLVVPSGVTTIVPGGGAGGQVTIEVRLNNVVSPKLLRSYQMTLTVVPQSGATGTLRLVDETTPWPSNPSIFIDTTRTDWVFAGQSAFDGVNPALLQIGAALISTTVQVASTKYCGTYVFQGSSNASGNFRVQLVVADAGAEIQPTMLLDQNGLTIRPFTVSPTNGILVTVSSAAVNDNCAAAIAITDGLKTFDTANATTDGPAQPGSGCDGAGTTTISNDVWYDYTSSCSGVLTASTCGAATFDTRVAVYNACSCPASAAGLLVCNDNRTGCPSLRSEAVATGVVQGTCYKVRLGATGNLTGTGTLTVTCGPDLCADAKQLGVGSSVFGSTKNTSVNDATGLNCGQGVVDSPGVWYRVTGTGNRMGASLSGTAFNSRLTVYQGTCGALSCVTDVDNTGFTPESASWCSTVGVPYLILVHGRSGATGTFTLAISDTSCNDSNACTADSCTSGACVNQPTYDTAVWCCAPSTGALTRIDDSKPCTTDVCNSNGTVSHTPVANGPNVVCNDTLVCTLDECFNGNCRNTDINTISCTTSAQCPPGITCGSHVAGKCYCNFGPLLQLVPDVGSLPVPLCFTAGDYFDVSVEMGLSDVPVVGAQFFLEYDASTLLLMAIEPGSEVDPESVFSLEFSEVVNPTLGTIDYMVGADFGTSTRGPETVAVLTFRAINECDAYLRYRASGPGGAPNRLTASGGAEVLPSLVDMPPVSINGSPPVLGACPANIRVPSEAGLLTARVTWVVPTSADSCDGSLPVVCAPANGSVFQPGTTPVTCETTNSCGLDDGCGFSVTVEPPVITVDVEASSVAAGPFNRCITFDVWDCNGPPVAQHATVKQALTFVNGAALDVPVLVPGGSWECMTARDELHTLRSRAPDFFTSDGVHYSAGFAGNRISGGHWLVSGNLNNDGYIDILDFGVLTTQHMSLRNPNTPCGTAPPDANINGDNQVDLLDLVIFVGNAFQASETGCCGAVAADDGPVQSISVEELRQRGLGHLVGADVNRDGVVDMADVAAMMSGELPYDDDRIDTWGDKSDRRRPPRR